MRHHEKIKLVRNEFQEIFCCQPPYPRLTISLKELKLEIADAKKQGKPVTNNEQEKPVTND